MRKFLVLITLVLIGNVVMGQVSEVLSFRPGGGHCNFQIGDATNDGANELVTFSDSAVVVYTYNSVAHEFERLWSTQTTHTSTGRIGDTDNDGANEILIRDSDHASGTLAIYEQDNGGWRESWSTARASGADRRHSWIGDSDNDGLNEVIIGVGYGGRGLEIYEHAGGEQYTQVWSTYYGKDTKTVQTVDVDGDGQNELLSANGFWSADWRIY